MQKNQQQYFWRIARNWRVDGWLDVFWPGKGKTTHHCRSHRIIFTRNGKEKKTANIKPQLQRGRTRRRTQKLVYGTESHWKNRDWQMRNGVEWKWELLGNARGMREWDRTLYIPLPSTSSFRSPFQFRDGQFYSPHFAYSYAKKKKKSGKRKVLSK